MPRTKPSDTIVHRIELGGKERQLIEDFFESQKTANYAASAATVANSITGGIKDIVSPFTQASVAGAVTAGTLLTIFGAWLIEEVTENKEGKGIISRYINSKADDVAASLTMAVVDTGNSLFNIGAKIANAAGADIELRGNK